VPRGHPGQVGVSIHCYQRGLGPFTAFEQPVGEVRGSAQLGDGHVNRADPGAGVPVPIAIALNPALGAGLTVLGTAHRIGLGAQQGVDHRLQQATHQVWRGLRKSLAEKTLRADNMRSGYRDDSVRVGCRRILEGSHGDRAATNSSPTAALHHAAGRDPPICHGQGRDYQQAVTHSAPVTEGAVILLRIPVGS